jgi:phenylpyruvate tautomerase PptA (4-oxalocrotonate tautomerase family)
MNQKLKDVFDIISKYTAKLSADEEVKMQVEDMTSGELADGTMIYTDAAEWGVGVSIFKEEDDELVAVEDGEVTLKNGQVIAVSGGKIADVRAARGEAAEAPATGETKGETKSETKGETTGETEGATKSEPTGDAKGDAGGKDAATPPSTRMTEEETAAIVAAVTEAVMKSLETWKAEMQEAVKENEEELQKVKLAAVSKPARGRVAKTQEQVDITKLSAAEVPFAIIEKFKN